MSEREYLEGLRISDQYDQYVADLWDLLAERADEDEEHYLSLYDGSGYPWEDRA